MNSSIFPVPKYRELMTILDFADLINFCFKEGVRL